MNKSAKREINNCLQNILHYASKLPRDQKHSVEAAVWDINSLVNETAKDRLYREFDELLDRGYGRS